MAVIDASVVVDWVAPGADPNSPAMGALAALAAGNDPILAPRLLWQEVGNALLTGVRRQRWTGVMADSAHRRLVRLPVRLVDSQLDLERAWELARRYDNHPIYDMVYVALAERMSTTLITQDQALLRLLGEPRWVVGPAGI
ncbi:MAG: type II toxin-antitoxin system VapC family toxin [Candidatus Dormibacteria bacterium]